MRMLKVPMPSYSFWILMETPINKISEIASWILPIYSSIKKKSISDLKNIYENIYRNRDLDKFVRHDAVDDVLADGEVAFVNEKTEELDSRASDVLPLVANVAMVKERSLCLMNISTFM